MNKSPIEIRDSLGRSITIKQPDFTTQIRFARILGPHASNLNYTTLCLPLSYVYMFQGDRVVIKTERDMEALSDKLGLAGAQAVFAAIDEHFDLEAKEG